MEGYEIAAWEGDYEELSPRQKLWMAKKDLFFFAKYILMYEQMSNEMTEFDSYGPHGGICRFIQDGKKKKKLILMPRGTFKSSVITVAHTLWLLINNPNLRIWISSENFNNSAKYLSEIKQMITMLPRFKELFGDWVPKEKGFWKRDEISISARTKVKKEPSITASSFYQTKTGMHYDVIIMDDVVSEKTVGTPEQIQKTLEKYQMLNAILDPGGQIMIVGTRYSYGDLYGHIIENETDYFDIHQRQSINKKGNLFFPERLTVEFLKEQRQVLGSYLFSCQYQNSPVDQENATFKKEWIKFFKKEPPVCNYFIFIDPAISLKKGADYTGIVVLGVDWRDNKYVVETVNERLTPNQTIARSFELVKKYNADFVGFETTAFQKTFEYAFQQAMEERSREDTFAFRLVPVDSKVRKELRIKGLQPLFENGKIYLKEDQHMLYDQIIRFPRTTYDDLIDALAHVIKWTYPPNKPDHDPFDGMGVLEARELKSLKSIGRRSVLRTKERII